MKFGDRGKDVKELQDFLMRVGYLKSQETYYSVNTLSAVKALQKDLELPTTGEFSPDLYDRYNEKFQVHTRSRVRAKVKTKPGDTNTGNKPNTNTGNKPNTNTGNTNTGTTPDVDVDKKGESGNSSNQQDFDESTIAQTQKVPCYIVNLITNNTAGSGVVYFPHNPEEFTYTKSNNYDEQSTKGRSEPFYSYANSSGLTVDISVTLSYDFCKGDIDKELMKLEALTYPRYSDSGRIVPPKCFFRCATFAVEGILSDLSITRKLPLINGRYSLADVSLSIIETNPTGISAITIQNKSKRK